MFEKNTALLKREIGSFIKKRGADLESKKKQDGSFVTELDHFISKQVEAEFAEQKMNFYCEENHSSLSFPSIILDPIDGTRDVVHGRPECCVSLAVCRSFEIEDRANFGWIYNPYNGFEISSNDSFVPPVGHHDNFLAGMVSRREWNQGRFEHFNNIQQKIQLFPKGSIALKLGYLAAGCCDFVISLTPKNVWDIAGGTLACSSRGIHLYRDREIITSLNFKKIDGPLIWSRSEIVDELYDLLDKHLSDL